MILVLSGKFQGEKEFAEEHFHGKNILEQNVDEFNYNYGLDIDEAASELLSQVKAYNRDIVLCHITGCGVVPIDGRQRYHAELVGRTSCLLAKEADEVWVVRAGIGQRIK